MLSLCKKHFGTRNLYKIFYVNENATAEECKIWTMMICASQFSLFCVLLSVQQSYKALSLLVHPDRAGGGFEATEKFQVLGQVYKVLMSTQERMTYDQEKFVYIVSEEEYQKAKMLYSGNYLHVSAHRLIFRCWLISLNLINYIAPGSEQEREDIRKSYIEFQGELRKIMRSIPFVRWSDQPRIAEIIEGNWTVLQNHIISLFLLFVLFLHLEMIVSGLVSKQEPKKQSRKRTSRKANIDNIDNIDTVASETKRTRRQQALFEAQNNWKRD